MHAAEPRRIVLAIPIRNEAERIEACLTDVQHQTVQPLAIVCLVNNCTDDSRTVIAQTAKSSSLMIRIVERELAPSLAHAGYARRLAMDHAVRLAGSEGLVFTTDADTRIASDWIERNVAAIDAGADAVCGKAIIDPLEAEAIPYHLHADDHLECRYTTLLDDIASMLDPDPFDPVPRHTHESGASIAVRVSAYRAAGGIPAISLGEDRAFLDALRLQDARIRHAADVSVIVSGRTHGRAAGGMADTMRRRIQKQDVYIDALLEPAADAFRRFDFRARLRAAWRVGQASTDLVSDLFMPQAAVTAALAQPFFGSAWNVVEEICPVIRRRRVSFADLPRQINEAEILRALAQDRSKARHWIGPLAAACPVETDRTP